MPIKNLYLRKRQAKPVKITTIREDRKKKEVTVEPVKSEKKRYTFEEYVAKYPDLQTQFNSTVDKLFTERRKFGAPSVCVLTKYFFNVEFSDEHSKGLKEKCLEAYPQYAAVFGAGEFPTPNSEGSEKAENNNGIPAVHDTGPTDGNSGEIVSDVLVTTAEPDTESKPDNIPPVAENKSTEKTVQKTDTPKASPKK